ncbi:MAG: Tripartite tricarboxylate transporter TctB family, partial [uncultured Ramlibacter sp.]
ETQRRSLRAAAVRPGRGGAGRHPGLSQDSRPAGRPGLVPWPDRRRRLHRRHPADGERLAPAPRAPLAGLGRLGSLTAARAGPRRRARLHRLLHPGIDLARLPAVGVPDPAGVVPGVARAGRPCGPDRRGRHPGGALRLLQAAARAAALGIADRGGLV